MYEIFLIKLTLQIFKLLRKGLKMEVLSIRQKKKNKIYKYQSRTVFLNKKKTPALVHFPSLKSIFV